jgi:hypothetical protein
VLSLLSGLTRNGLPPSSRTVDRPMRRGNAAAAPRGLAQRHRPRPQAARGSRLSRSHTSPDAWNRAESASETE